MLQSIGIAAAPKIKDHGLPDIDSLFGASTGSSSSSAALPASSNKKANATSKTALKPTPKSPAASSSNRMSAALSAENHLEQWDDDKELDALIGDD